MPPLFSYENLQQKQFPTIQFTLAAANGTAEYTASFGITICHKTRKNDRFQHILTTQNKTILVIGAAEYIGSPTCVALLIQKYTVVTIDNLSSSP
ncbi:hypothetical protein CAter282_2520 [Collimonas arenae]|uniref:UDP-glucose 4-epimerase n=1 Tax=Collimonas arenae TaxID=279058 RepID=A0A127QJL2_9BURK|nr:hypothetical protein CAter10_2775 [Collimonas arenae]AMP10259.1 hypothetical protein CAter282_2520 [Collimonas arenae]